MGVLAGMNTFHKHTCMRTAYVAAVTLCGGFVLFLNVLKRFKTPCKSVTASQRGVCVPNDAFTSWKVTICAIHST